MRGTVVIECFPESAARYREGHAIVAIDVVRATTTAIIAVAAGRRCFPVPTVAAAHDLAGRLDRPLLAGEQGGAVPPGFDLNNSPVEILAHPEAGRPVVLLSTSGTRLCHEAAKGGAVFLACLRNHVPTARRLAGRFPRVAVIGAGSRGEFREEDQLCCAWVAEALVGLGYAPKDARTAALIERWHGVPADAWTGGRSADYLRRSGQTEDLDYVLGHVADLDAAFALRDGEVVLDGPGSLALAGAARARLEAADA